MTEEDDPGDAPVSGQEPSSGTSGEGPDETPGSSEPQQAEPADAGAAEAEGSSETSPAGPSAPSDARPARRKLRIAMLSIGAVAAIAAAILVASSQRRDPAARSPGAGDGGGGAAVRAPHGPNLGRPDGVRIAGYVVDGAGGPVEGAEVTAELERGAPDRSLSIAAPGAGSAVAGGGVPAADAGADAGAGAASILVAAPTGVDGRFAIEGLVPGRYRLRVTGPGLLPAEVRYVPVPSDEARIVVARRVQIEGTVTDGGDPVPNANVGLRGEAIGGTIETRTDELGVFRFPELPEGRYQLFAWKEALAARAVRVDRLGAGPFTPVELPFEAASIVVGRVIDREDGTGIIAAIELRPIGDDQAPRHARSGDDGVFRIEGVPNGRWIADAYAPGYTSPGGVELEAGRGIPEVALARGGTIEGRVLDADGRPIAGASVRALGAGRHLNEQSAAVEQDRLRRFSGRMMAPVPATGLTSSADPQLLPRGELGVMVGPIPPIPPPGAQLARPASIDPSAALITGEPPPLPIDPARASIWITGADGRYRIHGLPGGKTAVLAAAAGFAEGRSKQVAIEPGQTIGNIDLVLTPGIVLVGRVTDQHGVPVIGAQITATPEVGAAMHAFSDLDGAYRLGPITGTLELAASAYGHADAKRTLDLARPAADTLGLAANERREDLVLEVADAMLAGTLDDETGATVAGAQIEVISGAGEGRHAVVAADGTFSIDMLPAGPLRVRVRHPDYPIAELDAVASSAGRTRVKLRLALGGGVEGALLEDASGSPLAGIAITAEGPGTVTADATSDAKGQWKLAPLVPGRWRLIVERPGYLPLARELDVPAGREPGATTVRDIRLELARGAMLGGTVRDARGRRVTGARVTVQAADGEGPIASGATTSEGEFRIHDCPTGELSIQASHRDARGSIRATVRPGDEVLGLALEVR